VSRWCEVAMVEALLALGGNVGNSRAILDRAIALLCDGKDVRLTLVNRQLTEQRPDEVSEATLADDDAILETLAERFGLQFPAGTRFAYK